MKAYLKLDIQAVGIVPATISSITGLLRLMKVSSLVLSYNPQ